MANKPKHIAVIGTGIAGLAAAARLAADGHKVTCFESNSYYGGKLTAFSLNGYRFDAGPSLFTLPQLVDDVFVYAKKNPRAYFNYSKKELTCTYFFANGELLHAWSDIPKFAAEVENNFGVEKRIVERYFLAAQKKYTRVGHIFMTKSLHKFKTWFSFAVAKALLYIPTYNLFTTMHKVNKKKLAHPLLVQYFNRYATYNGSNPYTTPGLLTMIPHLEHGIGTFMPDNGMHAISSSIYALCQDLGVEFNFNTRVEKIEIQKKHATGIYAKQTFMPFDGIVCNMDIAHAYQKLLPQLKTPANIVKQERSSSALVFYWGINTTFPNLDLHNILFSANYAEEFNHIFNLKKVYDDPTVYINISCKHVVADAPAGCENWFVMVNLPPNTGYFNENTIACVRAHIVKKINTLLNTQIEQYIACEHILDPIGIEQKTSSLHGSLYGTSSNSTMAAFKRHANFSSTVKNLFFCGGSVHPGGGIPLCLNSAKIVSELIQNIK